MNTASLEDVAFLARSEHRAEVLDRLTRDDWTRRELHDATGISQPTLGRILGGFEERAWAVKNGADDRRAYTLTPFGELLAEEFATVLETTRTVRELREVVPHLPFEAMDFELSLLREARVTTAQPDDVLAHMRRQDEIADRSDHVRTLCSSFSPGAIQAERDRIVNGDNTGEAIVSGDALDTLSDDDEVAAWLDDIIASGGATVYRYDGEVPVMLGLFDETAGIVPLDDEGMPCGAFIETDDEAITAWVADTLDAYRDRAEAVTAGDLPV